MDKTDNSWLSPTRLTDMLPKKGQERKTKYCFCLFASHFSIICEDG